MEDLQGAQGLKALRVTVDLRASRAQDQPLLEIVTAAVKDPAQDSQRNLLKKFKRPSEQIFSSKPKFLANRSPRLLTN